MGTTQKSAFRMMPLLAALGLFKGTDKEGTEKRINPIFSHGQFHGSPEFITKNSFKDRKRKTNRLKFKQKAKRKRIRKNLIN